MTLKHFGCNLNPWDNAMPTGTEFRGKINHVRLVLKRTKPIGTDAQGDTIYHLMSPSEMAAYYGPIAKDMNNQGFTVMFIGTSESFGDGGIPEGQPPWVGGVSWNMFIPAYTRFMEQVLRKLHEMGIRFSYQHWNEPDPKDPKDAHSSRIMSADIYGPFHQSVAKMVRQIDPTINVLTAGFCTGAGEQVEYFQKAERSVGGKLVMDFYATHPYGTYVGRVPYLPGKWFGSMKTHFDYINAHLGVPVWVTEWSGYTDDHALLDPMYFPALGKYLTDSVLYMNSRPEIWGATWFGVTDSNRKSGVKFHDGKPKPYVYEAFCNAWKGVAVVQPPVVSGGIDVTGRANLRAERALCGKILGLIEPKSGQIIPTDRQESLQFKIGNVDEWVGVSVNGLKGYIRGDKLRWL